MYLYNTHYIKKIRRVYKITISIAFYYFILVYCTWCGPALNYRAKLSFFIKNNVQQLQTLICSTKISSPRNDFLPSQNWMIHHLPSTWIVEIFPVGMQRCQFPRKSTFYFYQSWLHLQNYSLPELMFAFSDNRSMQLKFTVLETLSFPERFHALRKGPFVAPGSP